MFDKMIEEIYDEFKLKMKSGAYVEPTGNFYVFSKDVYNDSILPKYNQIKHVATTHNLNKFQKELYDLYIITLQKIKQSSSLLVFTVYKLRDDDLHAFVYGYEKIKKNELIRKAEELRIQKNENEKIVQEQKRLLEEDIKRKNLVLNFEGIEKIKNIQVIYLGGRISHIEFVQYEIPLSVYLYFDSDNNPFVSNHIQLIDLSEDEINIDDAPDEIVETIDRIREEIEEGHSGISEFFPLVPDNLQDFKLYDITIDFYDPISDEDALKVKKNALNELKKLDKEFSLLRNVKFKELSPYLPNCNDMNNNEDNYYFNCYRSMVYYKNQELNKSNDDLENVFLIQPQATSGLLNDIENEEIMQLDILNPSSNKNLFEYFNNNQIEYFDFEGYKIMNEENAIVSYCIAVDEVLDDPIQMYTYIPMYELYPNLKELSAKFKQYIDIDQNIVEINSNKIRFLKSTNSVDKMYNNASFFEIPKSINNTLVTRIGSSAFSYKKLTNIIIPDSIIEIESNAFSNNQLTKISIPGSVKIIGSNAFYVNKLTNVEIPNSVTKIGSSAFSNNELTNITIPNSISEIASHTFSSNKLTRITIPENIKTIGIGAFSNNMISSIDILGDAMRFNNDWEIIGFPKELKPIDNKKEPFNRSVKVEELNPKTFIQCSLEGKKIVVTGTLMHFTRESIKNTIIELGGKIQSNITSETDFLIKGFENTGTKLDKAIENNIKILSEEDFLALITKEKSIQDDFKGNNLKERLQQLKVLFEEDLITKEEYDEKKKILLNDL
jgi:hypothetical protein